METDDMTGVIIQGYKDDAERLRARAAALEAAHVQMQASLDRAYADRATYNAWAEEVRVTVAWMRDEDKKMRAALQEVLDDPLSDIRADMRFGIAQLINQQSGSKE